MLTSFQWFSLIVILAVAIAGGAGPLLHPNKARSAHGFHTGQAFSAGVFLALSTTMMLPSAFHLLGKAWPNADYPTASLIAVGAFFLLLIAEHTSRRKRQESEAETQLPSPSVPLLMTVMIIIPSFFLGTALGVSSTDAAIMIFIAVILHKGSAGFALALNMVRSTMTRAQTLAAFLAFAFATPLGILVGADIHAFLSPETMTVVKGLVLALAAGTFLFMSTLHELENTPFITACSTKKGFILMLAGFLLTALVRFIIGEAHKL